MGFGKDGKGVILREFRSQALGTLGNNTMIFIGSAVITLERFRMIKTQLTAFVQALTAGEGTGLLIGLVDGNFTVAQAEAALEAVGPLGPNESTAEELAERFLMVLGAIDHEISTDNMFTNNEGGHTMSETIRWTFARTKSWNWFVYNMGPSLTSGATARILVKSFGVWVT